MSGIREALNKSKAGKVAAGALVVLAVAGAGYTVYNAVGETPAEADTRTRTFIDAENGKVFTTQMKEGWGIPAPSPYSGKNTAYIAEMCCWTKDGKIKSDPTPVLLNENVGKKGPTFCPDCGRLVVMRNPVYPVGTTTAKPPPTQAEYAARAQSNPNNP